MVEAHEDITGMVMGKRFVVKHKCYGSSKQLRFRVHEKRPDVSLVLRSLILALIQILWPHVTVQVEKLDNVLTLR